MQNEIDTLLATRTALQGRVGGLAYRYTYGWEAMPVTVSEKINAIESEIYTVERALHAIYAQRGMLKPYRIHRTLPLHLQASLRTQLIRPMIFPDQDRRVLLVHPTTIPLVYRFDFPFMHEWYELSITCHLDSILATLEAMPTVELYGEDY